MQGNKRTRGRGRKPSNQLNRTLDSSGPDVKIRGTASHIYEKYQALARDANSSGDKVAAENYMQHAEHYYRLMMAAQQANQPQQNANHHAGANGSGPQPVAAQPPSAQNPAAQPTNGVVEDPLSEEMKGDEGAQVNGAETPPRRKAKADRSERNESAEGLPDNAVNPPRERRQRPRRAPRQRNGAKEAAGNASNGGANGAGHGNGANGAEEKPTAKTKDAEALPESLLEPTQPTLGELFADDDRP